MPKPVNISASRGAAILGLSKWSTPIEVWLQIMESREPGFCEKNNYELPVVEYSAPMRWGHAFESAIIELAESKSGREIKGREKLFQKDFLTCHVDGIYACRGCGNIDFIIPKPALVCCPDHDFKFIHEGKTTNARYFRDNFGEPGTDRVPIEYQIQCQHQMICTGAEEVILSVLVFPKMVDEFEKLGWEIGTGFCNEYGLSNDELNIDFVNPIEWARTLDQMGYFHQYIIKPHAELQAEMIKNYTDFWQNNVLKGIPPQPKKYDDIRKLYREPVGTIVADEYTENLMAEYKQIGLETSPNGTLGKRREQIKVDILKYMATTGAVLDDESVDKWVLRSTNGKKIAQYNGKVFR